MLLNKSEVRIRSWILFNFYLSTYIVNTPVPLDQDKFPKTIILEQINMHNALTKDLYKVTYLLCFSVRSMLLVSILIKWLQLRFSLESKFAQASRETRISEATDLYKLLILLWCISFWSVFTTNDFRIHNCRLYRVSQHSVWSIHVS